MPRRQRLVPLAPRLTEADLAAHRSFIATLGDKPIWTDYLLNKSLANQAVASLV
jgi:DNA polymerase-3 subunit epsilon